MSQLKHPYLTNQLLPYIGNKRKLLPLIDEAVHATGVKSGVFFDVFAGSGVVARYAKMSGFRVIANDWEPYAQIINKAYVSTNRPPEFAKLGGIKVAFQSLNALEGKCGYIAQHYCPVDDENYDTVRERMFYTQINGSRIDAMREQIDHWRRDGMIDDAEEVSLLAPLIFQAAYCSNTSGVFKGFHRGWGGATKTAWYRIRSYLTLAKPIYYDNGLDNLVLRADATDIAGEVECDIAYLDPPYNQHQYGANYHLLNTVALWDKPPISKHISGIGHHDKAAIRTDWRTLRRSAYCYKSSASDAFGELLSRLNATYILVSYSTDGIVPVEELLGQLAERGELSVCVKKYKRYRVSTQRPSLRPHTVEFVAIVDTHGRWRQDGAKRVVSNIMEKLERSLENESLCLAGVGNADMRC